MQMLHSGIDFLSIVHLQHLPILRVKKRRKPAPRKTKVDVMSVFSLTLNDHAPAASGGTGLLNNLRTRAVQYIRFRRTLNELSDLSNEQLTDLGLNRSMLKRVAYQAAYASE